MSRLTKKKIDIEKFSEKTKSRLTQEYLDMVELNNKLCEYEDFMEEQGFEDLEQLKEFMQDTKITMLYILNLTNRWQKLKEWVIKELGYASMYQEVRMDTLDEVKDKMQELEKE